MLLQTKFNAGITQILMELWHLFLNVSVQNEMVRRVCQGVGGVRKVWKRFFISRQNVSSYKIKNLGKCTWTSNGRQEFTLKNMGLFTQRHIAFIQLPLLYLTMFW